MALIDLGQTRAGRLLGTGETAPLYHRLEAMKQAVEPLYAYSASKFSFGNDHGHAHVQRVLERLDALLGDDPYEFVNSHELFMCVAAIVFHDIGILRSRRDHPAHAQKIIDEAPLRHFTDELERQIIGLACATHGSSGDIYRAFDAFAGEYVVLGGTRVEPRKIAALVRLADELDEDRRRANELAERILETPPDSKVFWEFCRRVHGIDVSHEQQLIIIDFSVDITDAHRAAALVASKNGTTQSFLRFAAEKLKKLDVERQKTVRWMRRGPRMGGPRVRFMFGSGASVPTLSVDIHEDVSADELLDRLRPAFEVPGGRLVVAGLQRLMEGDHQAARVALGHVTATDSTYPLGCQMRALYAAACAWSMAVPAEGEPAVAAAIDALVRWYEIGASGVWEAEGLVPELEVRRMVRDLDIWANLGDHVDRFVSRVAHVVVAPRVSQHIDALKGGQPRDMAAWLRGLPPEHAVCTQIAESDPSRLVARVLENRHDAVRAAIERVSSLYAEFRRSQAPTAERTETLWRLTWVIRQLAPHAGYSHEEVLAHLRNDEEAARVAGIEMGAAVARSSA